MFGLKLKLWMEAHLGRGRHKSSSTSIQTKQQQQQKSKDPNFDPSPNPLSPKAFKASVVNKLDSSSPSSGGFVPFVNTAATKAVPFPGEVGVVEESSRQELKEEEESPVIHHGNDQIGSSTGGGENEDGGQQEQKESQGSSSFSSGHSASILLGSFGNNLSLSSPDTGYSTDGYSPKSVYPLLSFESSGKSTPKSSYTISSLVSSELLNNSISCASTKSICTGIPSKNSSISNGLELEEEEEQAEETPEISPSPPPPAPTSSQEKAQFHCIPTRTSNKNTSTEKIDANKEALLEKVGGNSSTSSGLSGGKHERAECFNHHHRRTESMDGKALRTPASILISSHIPPECHPRLRDTFSICSPRRQRTKIKTNPWISFSDHRTTFQPSAQQLLENKHLETIAGSSDNCAPPPPEYVNKDAQADVKDIGESSVGDSVLYRISTSTSVSDSGKGSMAPSTNRNSTESSCLLLSDSASTSSTRNSIVSPEKEMLKTPLNVPVGDQFEISAAAGMTAEKVPPVMVKVTKEISNVSVAVKETDILSDWTHTEDDDDDGQGTAVEAEDGTDECITPTPSSPDVTFTSNSSSSKLQFSDDTPLWKAGFTFSTPGESHVQSQENMKLRRTFSPPSTNHQTSASCYNPMGMTGVTVNSSSENHQLRWDEALGPTVRPLSPLLANNSKIENPNKKDSSGNSNTIARGALGFLRKMFRKNSHSSTSFSSSPRTPRLGMKAAAKFLRSSRSNSLTESSNNKEIGSSTLIPAGLLSPESLVVNNYYWNGKAGMSPALLMKNGKTTTTTSTFLTPTPNAFRKRNRDSGSECSEKDGFKSSKSHHHSTKPAIKTDIIRLPHPPPPSSSNSSNGAYPPPPENPSAAPYYYNETAAAQESNTNTMSTTSSHSLSLMSTSTTSKSENVSNTRNPPPEPPIRTPKARAPPPPTRRLSPPKPPETRTPVVCVRENINVQPYDSPRLSRINSPSFNNYSPIHRLVVTGGNQHLLHHRGMVNNNASPLLAPAYHHHSPVPLHPRTPSAIVKSHLRSTGSPLINHQVHLGGGGQSQNSTPVAYNQNPFIASPSPILRNPRYQYITSSNQNSPLLNVPKRIQQQHNQDPSSNFQHQQPFHSPRPIISSRENDYRTESIPPYFHGHEQQQRFMDEQRTPVDLHRMPVSGNFQEFLPSTGTDVHQHGHSESYYDPPDMMLRRADWKAREGPERIYESVDDSDKSDDDGESEGGMRDRMDFPFGDLREEYCTRPESNNTLMILSRQQAAIAGAPVPPQRSSNATAHHHHHHYPMSLGTYLSETERRLLQEGDEMMRDRERDSKYKRLINEAEALLKEISMEKSLQQQQQRNTEALPASSPWHQPSHYYTRRESLRADECPQSDPLRRKAYDCWALRRLQQELAGCYASPPVLHRSRLHITSASTPMSSNGTHNNNNSPFSHQSHNRPSCPPPVPSRRNSISSSNQRAC